MSDAFKAFLVIAAVFVLLGALAGSSLLQMFHNTTTTGEEIAACQPTGWNLNRDAQCAQQVNVPNSEANLNNGLSRVYNAQATAVVVQAIATQQTGQALIASGANTGFGLGLLCGSILLISLAGVVILGLMGIRG